MEMYIVNIFYNFVLQHNQGMKSIQVSQSILYIRHILKSLFFM